MSARDLDKALLTLSDPEVERKARRRKPDSPLLGRLVALKDGCVPLVAYLGLASSRAVEARSTVDLRPEHIGAEVVLLFAGGDLSQPILVGVVPPTAGFARNASNPVVTVDAEGHRLVIDAAHEIVIRCGKASITLTSSGKILIQGTYVCSRSDGVNRVMGGAVHLN